MPNQDQGREFARAERSTERRPTKPTTTATPRSGAASKAPEGTDREASGRAHDVVVRARKRVEQRLRQGLVGSGEERGPLAGRGPKGYTRDDRRIREDICDLLPADSEVDPSEVVVSVERGEVTFDGTVSDRATKHYVECIGGACLGVTGVQNNLRTPGMRDTRARTEDPPMTAESARLEFDGLPRT